MAAQMSPGVYALIVLVAAAGSVVLTGQHRVLGMSRHGLAGLALVLGGLLGAVLGGALLLWQVLVIHKF